MQRTIKISTLEELQRSSAGLQAKLAQAIEHHFADAESAVKTELVEANEYLFQAGQALDRARDISERAFEFSEALDSAYDNIGFRTGRTDENKITPGCRHYCA